MRFLLKMPGGESFAVPCEAVDRHLKFASDLQLRVLLFALRSGKSSFSSEEISDALNFDPTDTADALCFWVECGILDSEELIPDADCAAEKAVVRRARPDRAEVARRGIESNSVAFLLREAEQRFGRTLRQSETSTLLWLHDDEGLDVAVILMLLEYAKAENRMTIGFIERTAVSWINEGVDTVSAAEKKIVDLLSMSSSWRTVEAAMGIEHRLPSEKEMEAARQWVVDWGFSKEMLKAAYDCCVDSISKFSMPYVKKILTRWHKDGVKTPADIPDDTRAANDPKAAYDIDLAEEMMRAGGRRD